nr:hypothetical protein [Kibdelosporangium sp. MJ126-NF4]CEL21686.1 hypothetical protein [Kibdelosporangium sp. MJ126-NF4]CTQ92466.1 hypothetical protein [Kibdelosporangium sp. MJ126-NF4]
MNDRKLNVGGSATGNFNLGDNVTMGNVTVGQAEARRDLLADLAALRAEVADRPEITTRIDDLEEEATAEQPDPSGGRKAFERLKNALAGVAGVTEVLATIEDQVRALFS